MAKLQQIEREGDNVTADVREEHRLSQGSNLLNVTDSNNQGNTASGFHNSQDRFRGERDSANELNTTEKPKKENLFLPNINSHKQATAATVHEIENTNDE